MKRWALVGLVGLVALLAFGLAVPAFGISRGTESDGTDAFIFSDGEELYFGTGRTSSIFWETGDANAAVLAVELPAGTSVDVPAVVVGIGLDGVDLGLFDGLTQPGVYIVDADRDGYIGFEITADDTAAIDVGGTVTTITIADDLSITGDVDITGAVTITGDTTQTGSITLSGDGGDITVGDDAVITDDASVGGLLTLAATSAVWDPGSLADGAQESLDVTVAGAALGDAVLVGAGVDVVDLLVSATVTAADTVTIVLANETGGAVDLDSSTWTVVLIPTS